MTEEEKEAIEQLKDLLEKQNEKEILTENLFENILKEIILVKKQQKVLEKKANRIKELEEALKSTRKQMEEWRRINEKNVEDARKYSFESERKNKIIDGLMRILMG